MVRINGDILCDLRICANIAYGHLTNNPAGREHMETTAVLLGSSPCVDSNVGRLGVFYRGVTVGEYGSLWW